MYAACPNICSVFNRQTIAGTKAGQTTSLTAVALTMKGQRRTLLVQNALWPMIAEALARQPNDPEARLHGLSMVVALAQSKVLKVADVTALKARFADDYGKYSFHAMLERFTFSFASASQLPDGAFLLMGPKDGLMEITLAGVKFRARRVEINREMNQVALSGSVIVVGGKLPSAPDLVLFIDGKQVEPPKSP